MRRGEIRLCRFGPPDKRQPALLLTRDSSLAVLNSVTVVPITPTRRGLASELPLGLEHGLKQDSAANFHNVMTIQKRDVGALLAALPEGMLDDACRALAFALGCNDFLIH